MNERIKVKRRNGFSDRNGIAPISKEIQTTEFSEITRNKLLNLTNQSIDIFLYTLYYKNNSMTVDEYKCTLATDMATNLFSIPTVFYDNYDLCKKVFENLWGVFIEGSYDEILDAIEYLCKIFNEEKWYKSYNQMFEEEYVGYRFIEGYITPITNEIEIESISKFANTKYDVVNEHVKKAIGFISENKKDYKNSIKESVSAVEALVSIILDEKGTLGDLLKKLNKKKTMHPALIEGISKIYGFCSDEAGCRHGRKKGVMKIIFAEAELILVMCSSIANYIIYNYDVAC